MDLDSVEGNPESNSMERIAAIIMTTRVVGHLARRNRNLPSLLI